MPGKPTYTDEELLTDLKRVTGDIGKPPTSTEYDEHGKYVTNTVRRRFGSWEGALEAAGLPTNTDMLYSDSDSYVTTPELINDIQRVGDELGHPPRLSDYDEHGNHHYSTAKNRLGEWETVLEICGFDPEGRPSERSEPDIPEQELIDELRMGAAALGHTPSTTEMNQFGQYSDALYRRRFGSWEDALDAAGLPPTGEEVSVQVTPAAP